MYFYNIETPSGVLYASKVSEKQFTELQTSKKSEIEVHCSLLGPGSLTVLCNS